MSASCVYLPADVFMVCLNHALSTEKEEVMGLLIGEVDERHVSHVETVIMLRRSDKRKDRVEISPEQLCDAANRAEVMARLLGRPLRVMGWYHSHPHITIWPSHVDIRTQATYQMMDEDFVGIILSVFNEDKNTKHGRIELTCFQSVNQNADGEPAHYTRLDVPLQIVPTSNISRTCLEALVDLPNILRQEEDDAYNETLQVPDLDVITKLHNSSINTKNMCHITEVVSIPMLQTLENRLNYNLEEIASLQATKLKLLEEIKRASMDRNDFNS